MDPSECDFNLPYSHQITQFYRERLSEVFAENVYRYVNGFPMLNPVDKKMRF